MRTSSLVLAGSLLTLLAAACGSESSGPPMSGAQLFENNCSMCHMRDGSGSNLAPTLHGKKQFWTRETLARYLVDPHGYVAKDPRLKAQGAKYSLPMPSYKMLARGDLEKLADHVLAMP